ncbi:MAG: FUSC family protein [Actinomycetota bacterium]|nr:FUSC family protein [Actinomycetota bacterium]MDP2289461.1 FUSC family protein [Actinomycetota bacterium]
MPGTDISKISRPAAIRVGLVIGALVAFSIHVDNPFLALPLAFGALASGLSEAGEEFGRRWRTMLWTTLWLMVSVGVAGMLSETLWLGIIATAIVALIAGYSGTAGPRAAIGGLLALVQFTVFLGIPDSPHGAIQNALAIGLGGIIQACVTIIVGVASHPRELGITVQKVPSLWPQIRPHLVWNDRFTRHALRLSVTVTIATMLSNIGSLPDQYWLPMTVAWMTRPDHDGTTTRIAQRIVGTLVGLLLLAFLIEILHVHGQWISVICMLAAALCVAYMNANYAIAVVGVTSLIVPLLILSGQPSGETLELRMAATVLAGIMAWASLFLWPLKDAKT